MNRDVKVYIAGHRGMVGRAIWGKLKSEGFENLIGLGSEDLDLRIQASVNEFFHKEKPEIVIDAAARVGGILANSNHPYQFLMENLQIQNNLLSASHENAVKKFIFLGSSCIYPKLAKQPLSEDCLLTGPLEETNEWYAIAKISGIKVCEAIRRQYNKDFVSLMPTNLYGPHDNFDLETSHVFPAMIRKFHNAKVNGNIPVVLWGSGSPMREFLHVDDVASAVLFALKNKMEKGLYNVGVGKDVSIKELAMLIQEVVGHKGEIQWDTSKPNGTPRKLMDVSRLADEGWRYSVELKEGVIETYKWYLDNIKAIKEVKI